MTTAKAGIIIDIVLFPQAAAGRRRQYRRLAFAEKYVCCQFQRLWQIGGDYVKYTVTRTNLQAL